MIMTLPTEDERVPLPERARPWPRRWRVVAVIGWTSFLAACLGTMLAFAILDPLVIAQGLGPDAPRWWRTRTGVYSHGFFLFWLVAAVAGSLAVWLCADPRDGDRGGRS